MSISYTPAPIPTVSIMICLGAILYSFMRCSTISAISCTLICLCFSNLKEPSSVI
uniref:Uncharacterized protein n=1 Tax=uncultured marine virus TaxID=186617 RepID=A0A0F7L2C1_9VIRU|nr:hypothetical protein [uncultured marine virus]